VTEKRSNKRGAAWRRAGKQAGGEWKEGRVEAEEAISGRAKKSVRRGGGALWAGILYAD